MKMASSQEKQVISEFIEQYRELPCLWDLSSENYKDSGQRKVAWEILSKKLKELDPTSNEITAKKKVDHLKYAYQREVKKVKESKRTGSATSEVYKPNLWYFELMTFLEKKNESQRSGVDSLMEENKVEPSNRKRNGPKENILESKQQKLYETAQALINSKNSETDSFGNWVGQKLVQIESGQREIAEKLISDVLFLAKTRNLRFDSRIDTPSSSRFFHYNTDSPQPRFQPSPLHHSSQTAQPTASPSSDSSFNIETTSHSISQYPQQSPSHHSYQIARPIASPSPNSSYNIEISPHSLSPYPQQSPSHHSYQIAQPIASPSPNSSHNIEIVPCSPSQYSQKSPLHHSSQASQQNVFRFPSANSPHIQSPPTQQPHTHTQHTQQLPIHFSQTFVPPTTPITELTSPIDDNQIVMYAEGPAGEILKEMLIFRK